TPPPPVSTVEPPQMGRKEVVIKKQAQSPSFQVVYHAPNCRAADFLALSILEKPLIQGESSRLYRRLVRQEQLAISVFGGISETIDPQLFFISVQPRPEADLTKIEKIIDEELNRVVEQGITDQEYQKALNIIRSNFYSSLQTNSGKANQLGSNELLYGSYENLFTMVEQYSQVKREDIPGIAKKYFNELNKTVGKLIPQGGNQ
ncbi:MAG: insulinase family protein, partial [Candidatus Saccharicenans sp.]|nr:insulinase family protein [Candidatus Saccharicenans sp.]